MYLYCLILLFSINSFTTTADNTCTSTIKFDTEYRTHLISTIDQAYEYNLTFIFSEEVEYEIGELIYYSTRPCIITGDGMCSDNPVKRETKDLFRIIYSEDTQVLTTNKSTEFNLIIPTSCWKSPATLEPHKYVCKTGEEVNYITSVPGEDCYSLSMMSIPFTRITCSGKFGPTAWFDGNMYYSRIIYIAILGDEDLTLTLKSTTKEIFSKEQLNDIQHVSYCTPQNIIVVKPPPIITYSELAILLLVLICVVVSSVCIKEIYAKRSRYEVIK